jgi:hypothetical protein
MKTSEFPGFGQSVVSVVCGRPGLGTPGAMISFNVSEFAVSPQLVMAFTRMRTVPWYVAFASKTAFTVFPVNDPDPEGSTVQI